MGAVGVAARCLGPESLLALAEGDDDDEARRHLGACAPCRAALAAVIRAVRSDLALDDVAADPGATPLPERFGRYRVVRRIGAGAMGEVFEAFDPELARAVAIKRLRDAGGRGRLRAAIREARSLARLADPHVVAVLEAGDDWIAMELVDGPTLAQWQRGKPWRRVLEVYLQAASGLAAAHRTGVVHRDFKPHNVLVDERDGVRAKVVDFGLAVPAGDHDATGDDEVDTTRGTGLRGTPAYMAPEQFAGRIADAASDQFALCIALWEALAGARPFAGNDLASLSAAVLGNHRRPRPRGPVPSGVWQALERGLRPDRRARFATIDDLIAALRRGARPRHALWIAAPLLAVAAIAVAGARNDG
jgi:serine/threonine protein kinase